MRLLSPDRSAERRPLPRKTRRLLRFGAVALALAALAAGPVLLWRAGGGLDAVVERGRDAAFARLAEAGLGVERIDLVGRRHTSARAVLAALAVTRGTPLLSVDLAAARLRLEKLPWVRRAGVQRVFPDALRVTLEERRPVALWQRKRRMDLLDESGAVIRAANLRRFSGLIVVVGDGAPAHATDLVAMLSVAPDLGKRVRGATWVGGRRWNLTLENGLSVWLPEADARAAWSGLAQLERKHGLLGESLAVIDLRFADRLIVRTRESVPPPRKPDRDGLPRGRT